MPGEIHPLGGNPRPGLTHPRHAIQIIVQTGIREVGDVVDGWRETRPATLDVVRIRQKRAGHLRRAVVVHRLEPPSAAGAAGATGANG